MAGRFPWRKAAPPAPRRTLTASAALVDLATPREGDRLRKRPRDHWQAQAWTYVDLVPEIGYVFEQIAGMIARMRLYPAWIEEVGREPVPLADSSAPNAAALAALCDDLLLRLAGQDGRHADTLFPLGMNLNVTGECYLLGRLVEDGTETGTEEWSIRSLDEIEQVDTKVKRVDPLTGAETVVTAKYALRESPRSGNGGGSSAEDLIPLPEDTCWLQRIWRPHPRFGKIATSPMERLITSGLCDEIALLGRRLRASDRSRLAGSGILFVPSEAETNSDGRFAFDPFFDSLLDAAKASIENEGSAAAVVPIAVQVPGPVIEQFKHLKLFDSDDDGRIMERINAATTRLARGLNAPPEIITGMADVNHWTAWAIDESTFKNHVEPPVQLAVDALTAVFLRPLLAEAGVPADVLTRLVCWYDPADLISHPNQAADAATVFGAGELSGEALRRAHGFGEDDAPSLDERLQRLVLVRGAMDGAITQAGIRKVLPEFPEIVRVIAPAQALQIDGDSIIEPEDRGALPAGSEGTPPADPPATTPAPAPPAGPEPETPSPDDEGTPPEDALTAAATDRTYRRLARRQVDIDRALRDRLLVAADGAVVAALGRAGAKVRSKGRGNASVTAAISGVPNRDVTRTLGRSLVAALGYDEQAVRDDPAWVALGEQWAEWVSAAQAEALGVALAVTSIPDDDPRVQAVRARQPEDRDAGWEFLRVALVDLATAALYDPRPGVPDDPGEVTGMRVPTSLVRGAVALAGGLRATSSGVSRDGFPLDPREGVGGVALGGVLTDMIADTDVDTGRREWVYGVSRNVFEPHARLDGREFTGYTDPVLANPGSFPPGPFLYPGDHRGCHCDAMPVYEGQPKVGGRAKELNQRGEDIAAALRRVTNPEEYDAVQRAIRDPSVPVPDLSRRG